MLIQKKIKINYYQNIKEKHLMAQILKKNLKQNQ
jgi:hypothetical protein